MKTWMAVVFLAGWVGGSGFGMAQGAAVLSAGKRPMTFADLQAMKRVSDPQISASGKWVMFSVTEVSLEKNTKVNHLWVVPIDGGNTKAGPPPSAKDDNSKSGGGEQSVGAERQLTFGEVSQTNGRFSPDGRWVLLVSAGGGGSQIWTAAWDEATGTMKKPHPLTNVSTEADGAVWSPDSKRILFVSSVYPECSAGPRETGPTWTEEDACDKAKDEAAAKSPVKAMVFDHLLYRHWDAYTGEKRSHVLVVSRENGEDVRDLTPRSAVGDAETPTFSLGGPIGYAWAPDSKEIAYVTNLDTFKATSTNNDVFTLRLDQTGAKAVKISTSPGSDDAPAYSPDGKWLAFRSQARAGFESDQFKLVIMDRATGVLEPIDIRLLNPPTERFTGWIDEFVWSPDGSAIVFSSATEGEEAVFAVDIHSGTMGGHPTFGRETLHGEYGDLRLMNVDHSVMRSEGIRKLLPTTTLVATRMTIEQPAEVVTVPLGSIGHTMYTLAPSTEKMLRASHDNDTYLTHLNDALISHLDFSKMESFWFAGAGDTKVEGFIIRPPDFDPAKKYPLKFLMHGGPQTAWGDAWSYRWNPELFAADGYVVVMINRRGSTGYGQKFIDEVSGDWGGKAYVDLMKGLDYAEQHFPFIDSSRECALGASYGGYMADWVLTHTNRFKCIVTHDGMYDPVSAYGTTEELWFNEWEFRRPEDFPAGWDGFKPTSQNRDVGHPDGQSAQPWRYQDLPAEQDPFRRWSPMLHIKDAKTPTLIIHSQKDYRLDVSQGFELFTALQRLGVPSKMLYFPDEGHWVLKPQNSELWYGMVNDWCDKWTKSGKYAAK